MSLVGRIAWMYMVSYDTRFIIGIICLLLIPAVLPIESSIGVIYWYAGVLLFLAVWIVPGVFLNLGPQDLDSKKEAG